MTGSSPELVMARRDEVNNRPSPCRTSGTGEERATPCHVRADKARANMEVKDREEPEGEADIEKAVASCNMTCVLPSCGHIVALPTGKILQQAPTSQSTCTTLVLLHQRAARQGRSVPGPLALSQTFEGPARCLGA